MKKLSAGLLISSLFISVLTAGGITADAGLTPPKDRIIFRIQSRTMNMKNTVNQMEMTTNAIPVVAAYGLSPRFTVIGRAIYKQVKYSDPMMKETSDINNILVMGKGRLYRRNTADHTIGVSIIAGGSHGLTENDFNITGGFQGSYRRGKLAVDLNLETNRNITYDTGGLSFNSAYAWLFPVKGFNQLAITPVLESTIQFYESSSILNRVWLSPGLKVTYSSYIFEMLYNNPVSEKDGMMVALPGWLVGLRLMF